MLDKASVHKGENLGYRVCRLKHGKIIVLEVHFDTYDAAEKYAETNNQVITTGSVYFPISLTSMTNAVAKEVVYD